MREEPDERLHWLMPREKQPLIRPDACARCYISLPLLRGFTCYIGGCPRPHELCAAAAEVDGL
jgi:hypothetical protein